MFAARDLVVAQPGLGARDLLHLAVCPRHGAGELLTVDRALAAAFTERRRPGDAGAMTAT